MAETETGRGITLPLQVDGMTASLSHVDDDSVEIQVESGQKVRLALTNYTGVIVLARTDLGSADLGSAGAKRRGEAAPDPADVNTVKKPRAAPPSADGGESERSDDDDEPACLAHVFSRLGAAGELAVDGGAEVDKGIFALLGNGKNPSKTGAVVVTASGYDPGLRRPEDITGGRKSGDGCMALPTGDVRGTSPQHKEVCYFEFALQGGLEMKPTRYTLRNGSKDNGTYLNSWVLQQCDHDGSWVTCHRAQDDDRLDGNRQLPCAFEVWPAEAAFSSRFRIRSSGAHQERHPLWLLSVEFFGILRKRQAQDAEVSSAGTSPFRRSAEVEEDAAEAGAALSLTTIPSSVSCSPAISPVKKRADGCRWIQSLARNRAREVGPASSTLTSVRYPCAGAASGVKGAPAGGEHRQPAGSFGVNRGGKAGPGKPKGEGSKAADSCKPAAKTPVPAKGIASFFQKKA